ncbi:MAG: HesB/IscA family protein [Elainellaceae cyanobacterium]
MIHVTDAATRELQRLARQQGLHQSQQSYLTLDVSSEGCLELSYRLRFESQVPESCIKISPGVAFPDRSPQDKLIVAIAPSAYPYIAGLRIDYSEDLLGGAFRFHNPNATSHCGCGQSFTVGQP